MEQRRLFLFLSLSVAFLILWGSLIKPTLFPKKQVKQPDANAEENPAEKGKDENPLIDNKTADKKVVDKKTSVKNKDADSEKTEQAERKETDDKTEVAKKDSEKKPEAKPVEVEPEPLPEHPSKVVQLGSVDPETGYYIQVELTSEGASINWIKLNDPRYSILHDKTVPLKIVGNNTDDPEETKTFNLKLLPSEKDNADELNFKSSLARLNWELSETRKDKDGIITGITFKFVSEKQGIELLKSYDIKKPEVLPDESHDGRDIQNDGYEVHFKFTSKNLAKKEKAITYVLQGPAGLPLENADNARKFRDIKMGFLDPEEKDYPPEERTVNSQSMLASAVVSEKNDKTLEEWKSPIKYIGVDNQYFAALVVPEEDQLKHQYIDTAVATVINEAAKNKALSDVSLVLTSRSIKLKPSSEVTHEYSLYAGPKRQDLLSPLGVDKALDFGWFGFVSITILMIMSFLHNTVYLPYGIAIICVTVIVRGMMYPISRKQAMGAKKMKELQPKIAELKKKYANQKEKMAQAQMQLFRDNNYNPFAGCLPVFLQLPVFIGLYSALNNSVDLRMAEFLWVSNLAAPDNLFKMPITLPFLGNYFNLLPLVTVGLFLLQQKLFMPPATDPEQIMQQKMMNYMMLFMGFMFYHVPAGLCIYFIASSMWGISERKMLDLKKNEPLPANDTNGAGSDKPKGKSGKNSFKKTDDTAANEKPKGFFAKIKEQVEAAADEANKKATMDQSLTGKGKKNRGNKKKK